MSLLKNLNTATNVEEEKDTLGGFAVLDTGLYKGKIQQAYMGESSGGAASVTIDFESDSGKKLKSTIYITSGKAKGQKTYYEKDGKQYNLPGFSIMNAICMLSIGKEITTLDTEPKVVNIYDYDAKKELPTSVDMLVDLIGAPIVLGIGKHIVDKNVKNDAGAYVPSGQTRETNEIEKVFDEEGYTVAERKAEAEEPVFIHSWKEKNDGVVRNKAKGAGQGGTSGTPQTPVAATPTKSLFT